MPTTFAKATLKLEILKQERKFCTPKGRKYLLLIFMYIFLGITNPYTYLLHSKLSMTEFPYGLESNVFGMSGMRKYFVTLVIQKYTGTPLLRRFLLGRFFFKLKNRPIF